MKPIRILHLITDTDSGGAEVMLGQLTARMDRGRFENHVVSMTPRGSLADSIEAAGIPLQSLGMRRGFADPRALWKLVHILRELRPAILQTWLYHADLLGTLASKIVPVPVVAWNVRCSAMEVARYGLSMRIAVRLLARMSRIPHAVAINTRAGRTMHEDLGYHPRSWMFLPNGFDVERFRPDAARRAATRTLLGIPRDAMLVGLFARNDPMKDHATFFEAVQLLQRPGVHYLLAGRGTERLRGLADGVAPGANIHLLGERFDMPELTAALDVACSSSAYGEGFPNAAGEAMACAVPCVVTDSGDAGWLVAGGGIVVAPRDPAAFARALGSLLDAPSAERQAFGDRGRRRIVRDFSIESVVRQYEEFYTGLAGSSRSGRGA